MKACTLLNLITIFVLKTISDEFCQTNLDGGEICEGGIDKDLEVIQNIHTIYIPIYLVGCQDQKGELQVQVFKLSLNWT